ncbi:MAG: putative membrane protein [Neolewinella sp.]|jgi:putative membrane protein
MNTAIILKGMAMGVAEAIPGVSGGTIAFITGIYARLLEAIGGILGPKVIGTLRKDGMASAWKAADGSFILQLGLGMVIGLGIAVFSITELLEMYPPVVWAFFFGLIIASAVYIGKQITEWNFITVGLLLLGTAFAFWLTTINPLAGSDSPILVFLAGAIAITALILPGISGSFILLLLGMYTVVLGSVKDMAGGDTDALTTVAFFGLGCLVGLALFSRIITYTFKTFPNQTLALLTGFMLGSLRTLWPWQNVLSTRINSAGEAVPLLQTPVLPSAYEGDSTFLIGVVIAFLAGLAIVYFMDRFGPAAEEAVGVLEGV